MKVLQINSVFGTGSTGRIVKDLNKITIKSGSNSIAVYGRGNRVDKPGIFRIGNRIDNGVHGIITRIFHRHGFGSKIPTIKLIRFIQKYNPDIIHLHNMHGYYININLFFKYIKKTSNIVVWTFHDCWPFTGHCAHYDYIKCDKWKTKCYKCPQRKIYPASWIVDNSEKNYQDKKLLFNGLTNLTIVTPSNWLANQVKLSFLKEYPVKTIYNGIDISVFCPIKEELKKSLINELGISNDFIIITVASLWNERKGLDVFIQLSKQYPNNASFIIVGVSKEQKKKLPSNIIGIVRTNDRNELAALYSLADVFVNPTLEETFGLTNIEALACGTPVITFNTGGSPEAIDDTCGIVVEKGSVEGLIKAIEHIRNNPFSPEACRKRAMMFDKNDKYAEYIKLYEEILGNQA